MTTETKSRFAAALLALCLLAPALPAAVHLANGFKIGEVTADSARVWVRLTQAPDMRRDGPDFLRVTRREAEAGAPQLPAGARLAEMRGAVPGAAGDLRLHWSPARGGREESSDWLAVDAAADFTRIVPLSGLAPGERYRLRVETRDASGAAGAAAEGAFHTPPAADVAAPAKFIVVTCHDDWRRDGGDDGFALYRAAQRFAPDFFVHTGDFIYVDKAAPFGLSPELARFKWNRTHAWPSARDFYRGVSAYFVKDDHDVSRNDSSPGSHFGALSWSDGLAIAREQLPFPAGRPFRTVRWGRDVELWLLESREFRSSGKGPDAPGRTVLGAEQKAWLSDSLARSDATFRIVVSGTPIVGPNVAYKQGDNGDSLADGSFRTEGDEVRRFLASQPGVVVIAGDRHWQYHSADPATGLQEFGCGPVCFGMAEEFVTKVHRAPEHRFLRVDGGFLSGTVERTAAGPRLTLRHHDVAGSVLHAQEFAPRS